MIGFMAAKSLRHRLLTSLLCIFSISLSVALYLGVERVKEGSRDGFTGTISGVDLIVGAKGSPLQLLLYSVFNIGSAVNNITYDSYEKIASSPAVAWTIPISLGDAYHGFRVVGTNESFFENWQFRGDQKPVLVSGRKFEGIFDVVLGSSVASKFKHQVGDKIVLSHGTGSVSGYKHEKTPFSVVGILAPTGTPIDRGVYVTLHGMEAMHIGWESGAPSGEDIDLSSLKKEDIKIGQITSFLVRASSRIMTLRLRRDIDTSKDEALMAVIPGLALSELWQTLSYVEQTLKLVALAVLLVGLLGVVISLYSSMQERRREIAILRSLGASKLQIFAWPFVEATFLVFFGIILGFAWLYLGMMFFRPWLQSEFAVFLPLTAPTESELIACALIFVAGTFAGLLPAIKAYLFSVHDGLAVD